jgi:hypothetical protein
LAILRDVAANPDTRVLDVRRRLQKPRTTIDRALAALHILGLLTCREEEQDYGSKPRQVRHYSLAADVDLTAIAPFDDVDDNESTETEFRADDPGKRVDIGWSRTRLGRVLGDPTMTDLSPRRSLSEAAPWAYLFDTSHTTNRRSSKLAGITQSAFAAITT